MGDSATTAPHPVCLNGLATDLWPRTARLEAGGDIPAGFADRIRRVLKAECAARRLPLPRLTVEPGRAIVSRAMVTLYHVIAVKHVPGARALVAVDGGMSDNPRPALYGARYTVRALRPPDAALEPMTVTGRYCEAGDVLAVDVPLPGDTRPGDRDAYAHQGAARSRAAARAPQPCAAATPLRPDSGPSARPLVLPAEGLRP